MRIKKEKLSPEKMLELLSSQWSNTSDIALIGACGINKAALIKKEIMENIKTTTGKNCPSGVVPTEYVKDYFGININYLKKFIKKEVS